MQLLVVMSSNPPASTLGAATDAGRARLVTMPATPAAAPGLSKDLDVALTSAAAMLRSSEVVTVLTGAGVSAESGIPTFRDALTGWWARFRPEELATPEAFASDPARVWSWYALRRAAVRHAQPNPAHKALVWLARKSPRCTLLTQNVDGLHEAAGHEDVVSLHGSLMRVRCSADCSPAFVAPESMDVSGSEQAPTSPPPCAACGAPLRPDVVWFGEPLPSEALERARSATFACDVFLSVGTSNMVEPAASLPWLAASHGATVLVVNPSMAGQRSGPSIVPLVGSAAALLPRLVARAWPARR
jgi:NAD-dependent deacetylase